MYTVYNLIKAAFVCGAPCESCFIAARDFLFLYCVLLLLFSAVLC